MPRQPLTNGTVIRLVKSSRFPKDSTKALAAHFEFNKREREIGKKTQEWLISVWDRGKASPDEALAHFQGAEMPYLAFDLDVASVLAISVQSKETQQRLPLNVLYDPLPETERRQGHEGHCAIDGLRVKPDHGEPLALRTRVADLAKYAGVFTPVR